MKNKAGGNQAKKKGRKNVRKVTYSLDDLKKGNGEEYAYVTNKFGDGRFNLICYDKVTRLGIVRGKIKNSCRMEKGSLALVSIREYEDSKCDILYHYLPDDIDKLLKNNILNESFIKSGKLNITEEINRYDDIQFTENVNQLDIKSNNKNVNDVWNSDEDDDEEIINTDTSFKSNVSNLLNINNDDESNDELDINDI